METTSVSQKLQMKQELNEEEDIDGNSKSLGNLPEELLQHILSFLPTTDAVRTSLLCKRWEYLWASIPNLDFHLLQLSSAKEKRMGTLFMNFVDRVLCLRDSSDIKRFTLCCNVQLDASRVNTWISAALRHNVQELYVELANFKGEFSLPYHLFTCNTLTSLHLTMRRIKLKLPTTICFSNLKILTIENVIFPHEYLTQQLFSGLPVLEELKLKDCSWGGRVFLSISLPKLRSLSIFEVLMPDVDYWNYFDDVGEVMILGDSLKEFYYRGNLYRDYCLYKSFSLEKAEINAYAVEETLDQDAYFAYKLLIGLSSVKFLKLNGAVLENIKYAAEVPPHMPMFNNLMPMFNNLMDLLLVDSSVDLDWETLLNILQVSPCLENLEFLGGISLSANYEEDDWILDPVPLCFLSHLKCIKVGRYHGSKEEFFALKILLKNSLVLEEIVITCRDYFGWYIEEQDHFEWNQEKQENLYKHLIELPRGSQNCKIVLK